MSSFALSDESLEPEGWHMDRVRRIGLSDAAHAGITWRRRMTDQTMLLPPGWGDVAAFALRHGRGDFVEALRSMDLELADEVFQENYGCPIREVEGFGPCWVRLDDEFDAARDDDVVPGETESYYQCSREACEVRTDASAFSWFDWALTHEPERADRNTAITAGLLRADLERLADLDREEGRR